MKLCSIEGCSKKHHGKGYCRAHYIEYILKPRLSDTKCSVERRQRERDTKSIISALINSESPLDFDIENLNTFSEISRLYYGDYCHECGWDKGSCEAHHRKPRSEGGKSTLRNAIILCPNCHSLKHINSKRRFSDKYKDELIAELKKIVP